MNEDGFAERRSDQVRALLVEQAVSLQQTEGQRAAAALLLELGIAPHIAMRVLACAAFRRKREDRRGRR
jgi:hypothetical protein